MFTKKIATLALTALIVIGNTGVTAFAAELDSSVDATPAQIMNTGTGMTLEEFNASRKTLEGLKNVKDEFTNASGLSPDEAKAQISEMKANGKTLEGLKNIQDIIGNIPTY